MRKMELIELDKCQIMFEIKPPKIKVLGVSLVEGRIVFRENFRILKLSELVEEQSEFPILAMVWAIDVIDLGFGRSPDEGGLPRDVLHAETVIDGEEIYIRRTMNCGAPQQQGYTLSNFSRHSYVDEDEFQAIQLPDDLLFDKGLLKELKDLVSYSSR